MNILIKPFLLFSLLLSFTTVQAVDITGRFSMLATTARATGGDAGYVNKDNTLSADQQSLRLMTDETRDNAEWSAHVKMTRLHLANITHNDAHSSDLFRYQALSSYWLEEVETTNSTHVGYEIDRALYKQRFKNTTLAIGRQSIDFGSGRFWQPLNVFGAFAPTDLDTDYKPGIDAVRLNWFPSYLSTFSAVYAFSPKNHSVVKHNASSAIHYRRQVGDQGELALLAGNIIGNPVYAASYESAWGGVGWRMEAAHYQERNADDFNFWIAGLNYQFNNGLLLNAEWYHNSRGAKNINSLLSTNVVTDTFIKYGLQQHLAQNVLGISVNKDLGPLWNGGYSLFASPLKDVDGSLNVSLLHQLNLTYSVSNESDLLISLQTATGRGVNSSNQPQSEFGHTPTSLTLRLRFYF